MELIPIDAKVNDVGYFTIRSSVWQLLRGSVDNPTWDVARESIRLSVSKSDIKQTIKRSLYNSIRRKLRHYDPNTNR